MAKLAFIGAGNLAAAMVRGLLARGRHAPADMACLSKTGESAERLARETGIVHQPDLALLLGAADLVVVAFKPQSLTDADPRLPALTRGKLVLSVLAGKKLATLSRHFPEARNIVRTMPNTPAAIGAGFTPYCALRPLFPEDRSSVEGLLGALGQFGAYDEALFDGLTGVGGCGPAFLFEFVAGLRDAGIAAGLPAETAAQAALAATLGAARLLDHAQTTPETLRDKVTSPNGATYAGLQVLSARKFRETLRETVAAAVRRSEEMSRG